MANYTRNERIQYHLDKAKVGAVDKNGKPLSDFIRGKHAREAERLIGQKDRWIETHRDQVPKANLKKHDEAKKRRIEAQAAFRSQNQSGGNRK